MNSMASRIISTEDWRPVVGFGEGYEISNLGRIRRIRYLRPWRMRNGYLHIPLVRSGVQTHRYVHRLVAEAFIDPIADKMEVNHINGVRDDNRVENLEIVTKSRNMIHAFRVLGR